jgi:glycosyltransferase involved in cell wall biosynthesis
MDPVPVLYVHYGDDHMRGSERALLDLFANLDRARIRPFLWCNAAPIAEAARQMDVPSEMSRMAYIDGPGTLLRHGPAFGRQMRTGMALIRRHGARVVHANSAAPVQWMSPATRFCRVPLLAHLHTAYSKRNRFALLLHHSALAVGVSSSVLDGLRRDGMADARLQVISNGIDPHRLGGVSDGGLRRALGIPVDAQVIGVAGSLIPRKATDIVLQAVAQLDAQTPPWLLVAGDGPDRARLEALAETLGLAARTRFIGDYTDAGAVFRTMDIHALASKDEAFGLVLVEAALCGVPNVASDLGGIRDVITDDITGLRVKPGDVGAFASALQTLLDDAGMRRRLGEAAREDAMQRFSPGRMAMAFHDAYDALLALAPRELGMVAGLRAARIYARLVPRLSG